MRRITAIGTLLSLFLTGVSAAHAEDPAEELRATLDGKPLAIELVGRHQCHDLDSPVITCYGTSGELEAAVSARIAALEAGDGLEAVTYVRAWEGAAYSGSSIYISQDYANLGTIGWNDRITAFMSVNDGAGTFHHDAGHTGTVYSFSAGQSVSNVGSAHNDKFSSIRRD